MISQPQNSSTPVVLFTSREEYRLHLHYIWTDTFINILYIFKKTLIVISQ